MPAKKAIEKKLEDYEKNMRVEHDVESFGSQESSSDKDQAKNI